MSSTNTGTFIFRGWPVRQATVKVGEDVKFLCDHIAFRGNDPKLSPLVELKWLKNGININADNNNHVSLVFFL